MIGKQIREIRTARKKTQTALAKESNISRTHLYLIEADKRSPSLDVLERICENLNYELRLIPKL